jgi:histidinol-phosphate aminotransferase
MAPTIVQAFFSTTQIKHFPSLGTFIKLHYKSINMSTNRRTWLKQSGLALAGLTLLNNRIQALPHYGCLPVPIDGPIRLSSNENPYGPSPQAQKAMAGAVAISNRYPWNNTTALLDKIAANFGLHKENVLLGAGSSDILGLVAHYASLQKGHAIAAEPSFRSWWGAAEKCGLTIVKVPLTADKKHDLPAMLAKVNHQTRLVYVCNPNNPTGTVLPVADLKAFVTEVSKTSLVMLDEAYTEYSDEPTLAGLVANNKNLIVVKTFSKIYGLAGARIGYALAHADTINQLAGLLPWANAGVSAVSLAGASASLDDKGFVTLSKTNNTKAKALTCQTFQSLGIVYIPSHTNFIYYSAANFNGDLNAVLKEHQISGTGTIEENGRWTRITVGTLAEMQQFTNVLKQIWK